jgi:hypothetical protein
VVSGRLLAEESAGPVHAHAGRRPGQVYRSDLPWSAPPPQAGRWTGDEELDAILASVDTGV